MGSPWVCSVAQLVDCLPYRSKALSSSPAQHKTSVVKLALIPGLGEVEAGGSGVGRHCQLNNEVKVNLGYLRPCLRERDGEERTRCHVKGSVQRPPNPPPIKLL